MKIIPTGHRVLVSLEPIEEKSKGGILLTTEDRKQMYQKAMTEATVEALGINAFKAFDDGIPWCKVGDKVLITKYCGEDREDPDNGMTYRVINDEDILAILEDNHE